MAEPDDLSGEKASNVCNEVACGPPKKRKKQFKNRSDYESALKVAEAHARTILARVEKEVSRSIDRTLVYDIHTRNGRVLSIYKSDIERLKNPTGWMNDTIIDAFGACIERDLPENDLLVLSSLGSVHNMKDILIGSERQWQETLKNVSRNSTIVLPFNSGNLHYSVIVVDCNRQIMYHFDSFANYTRIDRIIALMNCLGDKLTCSSSQLFPSATWEKKISQCCPQQNNGYDCGVYVCYFMFTIKKLVEANSMDKISLCIHDTVEFSAKAFRGFIETTFVKYSVKH
jgi:Ulp1 family protease